MGVSGKIITLLFQLVLIQALKYLNIINDFFVVLLKCFNAVVSADIIEVSEQLLFRMFLNFTFLFFVFFVYASKSL